MIINSKFSLGAKFLDSVTDEQVKNEPMLHRCTADFAMQHGDILTHTFLKLLGDWAQDGILIDSRSHMLMPTWFPAIPGYHHDDVPRSLSTGQPNYINPEYRSEHAMLLINAECAPTEFAVGEMDFELPSPNEITYKVWHPQVVQAIEDGHLTREFAPDKQIIFFDDRTWHQAVESKKRGWRWFIRATRHSKLAPRNEVRKQVQVYLDSLMEGW